VRLLHQFLARRVRTETELVCVLCFVCVFFVFVRGNSQRGVPGSLKTWLSVGVGVTLPERSRVSLTCGLAFGVCRSETGTSITRVVE